MKDLISRLKKRDESALKEIMDLYKNQIFNYLFLMTSDAVLAEELTQDTFIKAYFKAGQLKTDNIKAWLYTVATNLARSAFRKKRLKNILSLSDIGDNACSYVHDSGNGILINEVLKTLPEKYRTPLVMKEADNFSFDEISGILKKPVGTVKSLVFRAREMVRQQVKNETKGDLYGRT